MWTSAALADLAETWDRYTGMAGRLSADKTVREIAAACAPLQERPFAGRARNDVSSGLRSLTVGAHVVFYRIVHGGDAEILRVLDRKRDVEDAVVGDAERR
jgi:toxin ParE1/3/4